ncbi:MAG: 50S ribosome-binding GTPase [Candidatus Saccharibacteria bacterium]|nr:50S ribosome-binding GTPase [Candidatus Saccharibacteria bacterium]
MKKFFEKMQNDISNSNMDESVKRLLLKNLLLLKDKKVNLMITGATGCGKSSTINALFDAEVAKVGVGVDPETMDIQKYELDNLVLFDSPGLGDGKEADNRHAKNIISKLNEKDANGNPLIDLVLVVLDGSSRDLGTSYELINQVIIPNLGADNRRILVAINQADMAMKGRNWDRENNKPLPELVDFLEDKVESVKRRIKEGTGIDVEPIYYSAGFKDGETAQAKPYNLSKLLYYILQYTPKEKRVAVARNMNSNREMWEDDDEQKDYRKGIIESIAESVSECASAGGDIGEAIGGVFGDTGRTIGGVAGRVVGGAFGLVKGVVGGIFGGLFD